MKAGGKARASAFVKPSRHRCAGSRSNLKSKVRGFPFTVVYRDEPEEVVVFAIAPDRQQPGYWLQRASDE